MKNSSYPFLITIAIVLVGLLFWIATILGAVHRCLPPGDWWGLRGGPHASLYNSFVVVFLLLFYWNGAELFGRWWRRSLSRVPSTILILNAIAIFAFGYVMLHLVYSSSDYEWIVEKDQPWNVTEPDWFWGSNFCFTSKPYVGYWKVVSSTGKINKWRLPYGRLVLRRDQKFITFDPTNRTDFEGYWGIYEYHDALWLDFDAVDPTTFWKTELDSDRLVLESFDLHRDRERGEIVVHLERSMQK